METISLLLSEALTPYQVTMSASDARGERQITVRDTSGALMVSRVITDWQLADNRLLTDVVDGLHRDLRVAEGRLEPCMIAALRDMAQNPRFAAVSI